MVNEPESSAPVLDEWIREVGESAVGSAVGALKAAVEAGTVPVLRNMDALRAYWG